MVHGKKIQNNKKILLCKFNSSVLCPFLTREHALGVSGVIWRPNFEGKILPVKFLHYLSFWGNALVKKDTVRKRPKVSFN
jgi:hypothetical protein